MLCVCLWVYKNKTKQNFREKGVFKCALEASSSIYFIKFKKRIQIRSFSKLKAVPKAYQF